MEPAPAPAGIIGAVILGAGFGRRFSAAGDGADKRLQPLHETTVAECTVAKYAAVFSEVRVVVRADDVALVDLLRPLPVDIVVAKEAHLGMGHSLAAGFAGLTWTWAFVALLDMPFVAAATLIELRDRAAARTAPGILRPRLEPPHPSLGANGHPVGWHKAYFSEIRRTRGDVGAKALLATHAHSITDVVVGDTGVVRDVDLPTDLEAGCKKTPGG